MGPSPSSQLTAETATRLRAMVLGLLAFGLAGLATELLLLSHYDDAIQLVPLVLIAIGLVVIVFHVFSGSRFSVRLLQGAMLFCLVGGMVGIVMHYRGNLAFQLDMDPTQHGWVLFMKIIRAQAPPALAPGVMTQLGLLGLIYGYRHPALAGASRDLSSPSTHTGA